jgi:hypothetical protein
VPHVAVAGWLALVLTVPGAVALAAARHPSRGWVRLSLAVGLSVCLWPLLLLWTSAVGASWSSLVLRGGLVTAAALLLACAARRGGRSAWRASASSGLLFFVLAAAVCARAVQARGLVVPAWVDGLHHTVLVQRIVESGSVPVSLEPYAPVSEIYYHFGYHAAAAALALAAALPAQEAALWMGQALSAVAILGVYLLCRRSLEDPLAAVAAAAIPAALFVFPAYFVSWSRYPQLAGMVALPTAWILLADASSARRTWRLALLAGIAAGGLFLVHYRVAVFFVLGAAMWLGWRILSDRRRWKAATTGVTLAATIALAAAAPWLAGPLADGVRALSSASPGWAAVQPGAEYVPSWLFTARGSAVWMVVACTGLLVGLARRRLLACGTLAYLLAAAVAVNGSWAGLPESWMLPPFSLAIGLYLPVAVGAALLAELVLDRGRLARDAALWRRASEILVVLGVTAGVLASRNIMNRDTVIAQPADLTAATWIRAHTAQDARFLVGTAHWHLGTYRGLDGGYWLPLLAGRSASVPPALYPFGQPAIVAEITATCRVAAEGDALADDEILALLQRLDADYVYVGPASEGRASAFSAQRLRSVPGLREVYGEGGVHVFRLAVPPDGLWAPDGPGPAL